MKKLIIHIDANPNVVSGIVTGSNAISIVIGKKDDHKIEVTQSVTVPEYLVEYLKTTLNYE